MRSMKPQSKLQLNPLYLPGVIRGLGHHPSPNRKLRFHYQGVVERHHYNSQVAQLLQKDREMGVELEKELNQDFSIKEKAQDKVEYQYLIPVFKKNLIIHSKHLSHLSSRFQHKHIIKSPNILQSHNRPRFRMSLLTSFWLIVNQWRMKYVHKILTLSL